MQYTIPVIAGTEIAIMFLGLIAILLVIRFIISLFTGG